MIRDMQYMDHSSRAMDLAEKMAERRNHLLSTTRRPSPVARMARRLFAPAITTQRPPAEGRA